MEYSEKNIKTLSQKEAIQKRPGMYLGNLTVRGFFNHFRDLCQDFFQILGATHLSFKILSQTSASFTFSGLKDKLEDNISNQYRLKGEVQIAGFLVLNALSENFTFRLWSENGNLLSEQVFQKGELIQGEIKNKFFQANKVEITFDLDRSVWDNEVIQKDLLLMEFQKFAFLQKGKTIELLYEMDQEKARAIFHYPDGLWNLLKIEKLKGIGDTYLDTHLEWQTDDFDLEIAFAFREYEVDEPFILSFANARKTWEHGTHVDALLQGLTFGVMQYFQKYNLTQAYRISEKGIKESLIAILNINLEHAQYSGCVKNKLANAEIIKPIADYISEQLFQKLETNSEEREKLIQRFKV